MIALTATEFFARPELKTEEVPVPQFGEGRGVIIREFGATQRLELARDYADLATVDIDNPGENATKMCKLWAKVASWSMIDGEGNRLCSDKADAPAVLDSSLDVVRLIGEAAMRLNGLLNDDDEETDDTEPAKNE